MIFSGEKPSTSTFSTILCACSSLASLQKGKSLHGKIIKLGIKYEIYVGTALSDMYAKSGDIESLGRYLIQCLRRMMSHGL